MRLSNESIIEKAKSVMRESKHFEFKESFDVDSNQEWCEILKDIVAIANSGGGIIVFGIKNDGTQSGFDCSKILKLDPVTITDKINKYTSTIFHDFEIIELKRGRKNIAAILIKQSDIPMVFCKPGTYSTGDGKQKTAFGQGTVYFRHGAKSEPCNCDDLEEVIQRNIEKLRKAWLGSIKKIVTAPNGSKVHVLPSNVIVTTSIDATPIRITDDEKAPTYHIVDPSKTHPLRQRDVIDAVKKATGVNINSFHLLCIKKEFKIKEERPDFCYKSMFNTFQYSTQFVEWLTKMHHQNKSFFDDIRAKHLKR